MAQILYRAEAKGIQEWILASDRLRELKGGSAIIDALPTLAAKLVSDVGGKIITSAAGAIEAQLPDEAALQKVASVWPLLVEINAPGLTLVQAWVTDATDAKATRSLLMTELANARNLAAPALPHAGPFVARSARTGLPASDRLPKGNGNDLADPAVARKVAMVNRMRTDKRRDAFDALLDDPSQSFVEDTNDFGEGYIAVIHADGNAIGERIMALPAGQLSAFSHALTAATRGAAKEAFAGVAVHEKHPETVLARPIVLGGDDLTAIVAADQALGFVQRYLEAFTRLTSQAPALAAPQGLTASAGVALVKVGFPFHAAHELAESLCKGAKRSGKPTTSEARILFHRITTANPELDWDDILAAELSATGPNAAQARLSDGPYCLEDLDKLIALRKAMKAMPRGTIREWLRLAAEDPTRAQPFWERMKEVAKASRPKQWAAFANALEELGHDANHGWKVGSGTVSTALLDAALLKYLAHDEEAV